MPDLPLTYGTESGKKPGVTVLTLVGPLTLSNLFEFQAYFRQLTPPVLIVDLSQVTYMDSAGLGLLMNGYVSAEGRKNKFLLAAVNERVNALLQLTRVDTVLHIFPSVDAAEVSA